MTEPVPIPLIIRTRLAHATLQAIADECGADILHIKGAAVDPSLLPQRQGASPDASPRQRAIHRVSSDADVLVRPEHLSKFLAAAQLNGWDMKSRFYSKGAFEHSVDMRHESLGWADVHCRFPGIQLGHGTAFDLLWEERCGATIANRTSQVPCPDAQRLILLLHAARQGTTGGQDVQLVWTEGRGENRAQVLAQASRLHAEMALAAATGHLADFSDQRGYDLWRVLADPSVGVFDRWLASVKAAPTTRDRIRILVFPLQPKADRMQISLGRPPTALEIALAYSRRMKRGATGIWHLIQRSAIDKGGFRP